MRQNVTVGLLFLTLMFLVVALHYSGPSGTPIQNPDPFADAPTTDFSASITLQPPSTYNIIYLVTNDGFEPRGMTSPDGMLVELTAAHVAQNAEELWALRESIMIHAIDAVIIHESAYEWVDREWTSTLAQSGTPVAVINMYVPEMAELINDDSMRRRAADDERLQQFGLDDVGADHFYITSGGRGSQYWLTHEAELKMFVQMLQSHIEGAREFRRSGVNRALTPQSTPDFLGRQGDEG